MADAVDLSDHEQRVLAAVGALEQDNPPATIRTIADRADLDVDTTDDVLSRLTDDDRDLLRERRVELDSDATGAGREYTIKAKPTPS